jgi:type I restriction enzyme M protein
VILNNPPFGGEEEKGIQGNFPEDQQTADTALLFLQLKRCRPGWRHTRRNNST